ncbi:alpha-hydroxy-acid oxidizing protein [Pseudonocardia kujensis]|uniref:alpha-hydroxy acid oxidase n=1 Tax=Pseudonocardia kujensis TaxID=1128675 RepID=UPI001E2D9C13|nr:alpha-hydroxy acid oxidase [Pseudonocardia kujensis]MCE0761439.1 alpha-hydroxy-acid oxidizing protein [Pseudonocardia kujensis]
MTLSNRATDHGGSSGIPGERTNGYHDLPPVALHPTAIAQLDSSTVRRRVPRWSEFAPLLKPRPVLLDGRRRRAAAAASVEDLRRTARRRTPRAVFDYVDGGAEREVSLRRSREAFDTVEFRPSVLRDVSAIDTSATVLGASTSAPLVLGPTGFTRMLHHEGEIAVGRAARRARLPYALSTMGTTSPEDLAAAAPGADHWFQLYLWRDRDRTHELISRARAAGLGTLVLTVDTPVPGARLRDVRNGMTIPPTLTLRTFLDGAVRPWWWFNMLTTPPLEFAALSSFAGTVAELGSLMFDPSATVRDVHWLREIWPGKLVVKGLARVEDALSVVDAGVDAVVLSNHGGRQLDRAPTPLEQLPAVVKALDGRAEVYVDGGVMSGADIVAAVCLGATAVLIGRAYLYGLMAAGERGVDRVLEILRSDVRRTMQLLGATTVDELTADRVRFR